MNDRRNDPRRTLPPGRSALLRVDGRDHIVALLDLSRGGALLGTRLDVSAARALELKVILPQGRGEMVVRCQLVRAVERGEVIELPACLAMRFPEVSPEQIEQLEAFVSAATFAPGRSGA